MNAKTKKFLSSLSHSELLELNLEIEKKLSVATSDTVTRKKELTEYTQQELPEYTRKIEQLFKNTNHPTRQNEFCEIASFFIGAMGWYIDPTPVVNKSDLTCWKVSSGPHCVGLWLSPSRMWSLEHIKFSNNPTPFTGEFDGMDEQENFDIMLADAGIEIAE